MAITPLPEPPSRSDAANFAQRADAFLASLPTYVAEFNALQVDVTDKQGIASSAASTATTKASEASGSASSASASAGTATTKAGEASSHASSALSSKNAAAQSESNAATSEMNAQNYAASVNPQLLAADYANATEPAVKWPYMKWADTGNMLLKRRNADNTAWVTLGSMLDFFYSRSSIIGPVSMSDDKPSGGIIESGSVGNARYTRFADGSLEMTMKGISISTSSQNVWVSTAPISTPAEFIDDGSFVGIAQMYNNPSAQGPVFRINPVTGSTNTITLSALSPIGGATGMLVQVIMKARWA